MTTDNKNKPVSISNKRLWCIVCGAIMDKCIHGGPYTDDLNKAYKIWMDHKKRNGDEI